MERKLITADHLVIAETAFIAPGARLVGDVAVGDSSSIWFNAVLRGDTEVIRVGQRTNIQDGTVIHCDDHCPTLIGDNVTIGHGCIIHGAVIEDNVLVGMGARILSGARIGEYSFLAAGTLIPEGMVIPPRSLVKGFPGRIVREVDENLIKRMQGGVEVYMVLAAAYRDRYSREQP